MSYETILIDFKDLERPEIQLLYRKTIIEFNEAHQVIGMVRDDNLQMDQRVYTGLINKAFGTPLYWYYELLDHAEYLYPPEHPYVPDGEVSYLNIPYGNEHIIDHDTQAHTYGSYYPYPWIHFEGDGAIFVQGLLFIRAVGGGDTLMRLYRNGGDWLPAISTAIGGAGILGITYMPGTDRLNANTRTSS